MEFSFRHELAKIYGTDEAVFLHYLYFWILKNEANGRHFYDGKNWTYNSMEAFVKLFPHLTKMKIRRIIKNLENNGAIYIGNYNKSTFDRTQWYALSDQVLKLYNASVETNISDVFKSTHDKCSNQHMTSVETNTTIPVTIPVTNTVTLPIKEAFSEYTDNPELLTALLDYEHMRKTIKSPLTDKAKELLLKKLDRLAKTDIVKIELLNDATLSNWKSVYSKGGLKKETPNKSEQKSKSYDFEENFKNSWSLIHDDD